MQFRDIYTSPYMLIREGALKSIVAGLLPAHEDNTNSRLKTPADPKSPSPHLHAPMSVHSI